MHYVPTHLSYLLHVIYWFQIYPFHLFSAQSLEYGAFKQVFSSVVTLTKLTFSINFTIFIVIFIIYNPRFIIL